MPRQRESLEPVLESFKTLDRGERSIASNKYPSEWLGYLDVPCMEPVKVVLAGNTRTISMLGVPAETASLLLQVPTFEGLNPDIPEGLVYTSVVEQLLMWALREEIEKVSAPQEWEAYFDKYFVEAPTIISPKLVLEYSGLRPGEDPDIMWHTSCTIVDGRFSSSPPQTIPGGIQVNNSGTLLDGLEAEGQRTRLCLVMAAIFAAQDFTRRRLVPESTQRTVDEQREGRSDSTETIPFEAIGAGSGLLDRLRDLPGVGYSGS